MPRRVTHLQWAEGKKKKKLIRINEWIDYDLFAQMHANSIVSYASSMMNDDAWKEEEARREKREKKWEDKREVEERMESTVGHINCACILHGASTSLLNMPDKRERNESK